MHGAAGCAIVARHADSNMRERTVVCAGCFGYAAINDRLSRLWWLQEPVANGCDHSVDSCVYRQVSFRTLMECLALALCNCHTVYALGICLCAMAAYFDGCSMLVPVCCTPEKLGRRKKGVPYVMLFDMQLYACYCVCICQYGHCYFEGCGAHVPGMCAMHQGKVGVS